MNKPEALRLADDVELNHTFCPVEVLQAAAAELRRLHELALEQQGKIYALEMARSMEQKTAKLKQDALLEALKGVEDRCASSGYVGQDGQYLKSIRAAISKAEGEQI